MLTTQKNSCAAPAKMAGMPRRPGLPRGYTSNKRLSFAPRNTAPRGDTLVVVFLRGAADGLNIIIPHAEEAYHRLRPSLRLPRPDDIRASGDRRTIDLDGFFGFHPALRPLLPAWQAGQLACIQACGAPDESRSHFKAMELMERGTSEESGPSTGWIGRHLATLETGNPSPLRAIGLGEQIPRSLYGPIPASSLRSIADFHLGRSDAARALSGALSVLYAGENNLSVQGQETLQIMETLEKLDPTAYTSAGTAYPESDFGQGLAQIAMLIKAEVGLETSAIDLGGWDTHFAQGVQEGLMARLLEDLSAGLAAFHSDLEKQMAGITLVVMTEFGRRAYENASLGTDHGHGSFMFVLSGSVNGSQVITNWPGLGEDELIGPGDLAVTMDYRDVLGEILTKRLHNPALDQIFPGYKPKVAGVID
ncbi:MAG: DUF1501 domain-containing protein [Chloroflexi bacterium]|nr:DUF1501 domain-containing protein [Chloroflexota bacterium]